MDNIKQGSIIKGPNWPEPVEIKLIEEAGDYIHIVGATQNSRQHVDDLIPRSEFMQFKVDELKTNFAEDPLNVFLALETTRYRFASMYDPLIAMNTSKVDPLPHQIDAVYGSVLHQPRIRFMIADDPGAGKTIMAGLTIKELKIRNLVKRILIVAPGHLKDQWRRELAERFEEHFVVVGRHYLDALYGHNVWLRENQIITSIDFAKREEVLPSISAAHFDLIIVDEAHKMSAYRYGDKIDKTSRYRLGEALSRITDHLLFLTATPHKGDPENFRLFLDLIEPGFFATNDMVQESLKNKDNPLFIRRIKEDLKDFEGKPLFLPRNVATKAFRWGAVSPKEAELYNALSKYVEEQYNKALKKDKRRNIAFALVILQRRLASSTYALLRSLERRKKRLEDYLKGAEDRNKTPDSTFDFETIEDMSEEDRWQEEEIWETLSVAENREELEKEIRIIEGLIDRAKKIIQSEEEVKLKEFKTAINELGEKYPDPRDKKILVFTESKDTLEYLEKKIKTWGYSTNTIHGGMKLEERVKAESIFKHETDVMVATEAAGEGINLQFCHLMINYDIPWNPNRLEQRMGRIHRYGQTKEVYIYNLVAADTREGRVLHRLFEKLDEIRNAMGSDKVFDVLGEVLYDKNLSQLMVDAAAHARELDDILKEIEITVDEKYIAPIVLKEKYLTNRGFVPTHQLFESSLKTPGEARPVSKRVLEQSIVEGVQMGLFGLGELDEDIPQCIYFKEYATVSFTGNEILIKDSICNEQKRQQAETLDGKQPYEHEEETETKSELDEDGQKTDEISVDGKKRLRLKFQIPKGKVAGIMGVMNLLQNKFNVLEIELSAKDGEISKQDLEDKIGETFRQLNIDFDME